MNENLPDGAADMNRSLTRTALAVGGRVGEILARQRAEAKDQLLRAAIEDRRRLEDRFEAERAVMRTELAPVHQDRFWAEATPEQVGERYAQARHWEPFDDLARTVRQRMEHEITARYHLSPEQYLAGRHRTETERGQETGPEAGARRAAAAELAEAERLSAAVAREDLQNNMDTQNAEAAAEELWDSAARRRDMAEDLTGRFGDTPAGQDGTEAVLAADRDSGTPPVAAVQEPGHAMKGRRYGGRGQGASLGLGHG